MNFIKKIYSKYKIGERIVNDKYFIETNLLTNKEVHKNPRRTDIINFFISLSKANNYLEIGVRDPRKNFLRINCTNKFSVDPGVEFVENPVDYKMTSDMFFDSLNENKIKELINIKFDVIFIDGLHTASQVDRDIKNSLRYLKNDGFLILHDCNPPSEFHQRECYDFVNSPANTFWNGTTWKAFYKYRHKNDLFSICFDTDWGVGVISKTEILGFNNLTNFENEFYEFSKLNENRKLLLNLNSFEEWKSNYYKLD